MPCVADNWRGLLQFQGHQWIYILTTPAFFVYRARREPVELVEVLEMLTLYCQDTIHTVFPIHFLSKSASEQWLTILSLVKVCWMECHLLTDIFSEFCLRLSIDVKTNYNLAIFNFSLCVYIYIYVSTSYSYWERLIDISMTRNCTWIAKGCSLVGRACLLWVHWLQIFYFLLHGLRWPIL